MLQVRTTANLIDLLLKKELQDDNIIEEMLVHVGFGWVFKLLFNTDKYKTFHAYPYSVST